MARDLGMVASVPKHHTSHTASAVVAVSSQFYTRPTSLNFGARERGKDPRTALRGRVR